MSSLCHPPQADARREKLPMKRVTVSVFCRALIVGFVSIGALVLSGATNPGQFAAVHSQDSGSIQSEAATRDAIQTLLSVATRHLKRAFPNVQVESLACSVRVECDCSEATSSQYVVSFEAEPPPGEFVRGERYILVISSTDLTVTEIDSRPPRTLSEDLRDIENAIRTTLEGGAIQQNSR